MSDMGLSIISHSFRGELFVFWNYDSGGADLYPACKEEDLHPEKLRMV